MGKQEELSLYSTPYFHAGILYRSSPTVKTNRFLCGNPDYRSAAKRRLARRLEARSVSRSFVSQITMGHTGTSRTDFHDGSSRLSERARGWLRPAHCNAPRGLIELSVFSRGMNGTGGGYASVS